MFWKKKREVMNLKEWELKFQHVKPRFCRKCGGHVVSKGLCNEFHAYDGGVVVASWEYSCSCGYSGSSYGFYTNESDRRYVHY